MDVVIFGNGGHALDIRASLDDDDRLLAMVCDDDGPDEVLDVLTFHVMARVIVGINDSATRRRVTEGKSLRHSVFVHDWIHPAAHLGPEVNIGEHTHVNAGAFLTRCTLGDFVTVGPNATICGDVTIGDDVMIGAGAVIRNLLTVGDGAVIGCGAVVVHDVPPGVTVVGNPARAL